MAKLGNLYVSLIADTASFSSGLSKARSDLNSAGAVFNRGLASIDKSFSGLGRAVKGFGAELFSLKGGIGALVGIGAGGGLIAMAKQAADSIGGLGELAGQLGITTDTLQAFSYAATQVGLSQEELETGIGKLTKTIGDAANGNKAAIDSFNRFGIKILDAQGNVRSTDAVIRDISDAMADMKDPADRAAIATQLMGRAGQKLIPFLQDGAAGIDAFVQQAREMGVVLDRETIAKADDASDKIAALSKILTVNFNAALVELAPILAKVAGDLANFTAEVRKFWDTFQSNTSAKSTSGLLEELDGLQKRLDKLKADKALQESSGMSWLGNIFGGNESQDKSIRDIEDQIARVQALIRARRDAIDPFAKTGGATNPTPPVTGKTDAEKEIEAAQRKLQQLQGQVSEIGKTGADLELTKALEGLNLQNPGVAALVDKFKEAAAAIQLDKDKTDALDAALKSAQESMDAFNKEQQEGKQIAESLRTPQEEYAVRLAKLSKLLEDGAIDGIDYGRAVEQAKNQLDEANQSTDRFSSTMADLGATWSSAFEDAALSMQDAGFSAESLSETLQGLLKDIERIILRIGVTDPIATGLTDAFKSIDWGKLFSSAPTGHQAAISSGSTGSSGGFWGSILSFFGFHGGGIAGGTPTFQRSMPMAAFAGAPRLHSGGFIGPGEVPAILKRGEGVFTAEQMANMAPAGGGGDVIINVTTPPGGSAETSESTGPNGQKQVDIMVKDSFDRLAGRGALDKTMSANWGSKRRPGKSA